MSWIVVPNWERFQHYTTAARPGSSSTPNSHKDEWQAHFHQTGVLVCTLGRVRGKCPTAPW